MATVAAPWTTEPHPKRWSRDEFCRMAELGWFDGQHAELLDGEVFVSPVQNNPHFVAVNLTVAALQAAFGPGHWVRPQGPLHCDPNTDAEPDVAVVPGSPRDYTDHPRTALLVVEVSDTTLAHDRRRKGSFYARAGIADYWIVNLVDRRLEVHRNPIADAAQTFGFRYADTTVIQPGQSATPLAAPQANVAVADLLP